MLASHWALVKSCGLSEIRRRPSSVSFAARGVADRKALSRSSQIQSSADEAPVKKKRGRRGRAEAGAGWTGLPGGRATGGGASERGGRSGRQVGNEGRGASRG